MREGREALVGALLVVGGAASLGQDPLLGLGLAGAGAFCLAGAERFRRLVRPNGDPLTVWVGADDFRFGRDDAVVGRVPRDEAGVVVLEDQTGRLLLRGERRCRLRVVRRPGDAVGAGPGPARRLRSCPTWRRSWPSPSPATGTRGRVGQVDGALGRGVRVHAVRDEPDPVDPDEPPTLRFVLRHWIPVPDRPYTVEVEATTDDVAGAAAVAADVDAAVATMTVGLMEGTVERALSRLRR